MIAPTLNQIEELIGLLSYQEQLWLLERLAQRLRRASMPASPVAQHQPVLLSDDPAVQAELRAAGDRLLRQAEQAKARHEESVRAWDEAMAAMGINVSEQPIGAEALRQMMIAEGINPEDNEFSRGIIEMREE
jgi:hypothetical protein